MNPRPKTADEPVRILIIAGGCFRAAARDPAIAGADIVVHVDVAAELWPIEADWYFPIAVGGNDTAATLLADGKADPALRQYIQRCPGLDSRVGLGQVPRLGRHAWRKALGSGELEPKLDAILNRARLLRDDGVLGAVEICDGASGAGATGNGVGPEPADLVAKLFLDRGAKVVRRSVHAGALSFVGVGSRTDANSAAATEAQVDHVLDRKRHPKELRSLTLTELPMAGNDSARRWRAGAQVLQALNAPELQEEEGRAGQNSALDGPFGSTQIATFEFGAALSDRQAAREVAREYLVDLDEGLLAAAKSVVRVVELEIHQSEGEARPIEELLREAAREGAKAASFEAAVCMPDVHWHATGGTIWVELPHARWRIDHGLTRDLLRQARNLIGVGEKLDLCSKLLSATRTELSAREQRSERRSEDLARERATLRKALSSLYPDGARDRFLAQFRDRRSALQRLKAIATRARGLASELSRLEAESDLLRQGIDGVLAVVDAELRGQLARLHAGLERVAGGARGRSSLLRAKPLDACLGRLMALAATVKDHAELEEALVDALAGAVRHVTLAGIANLVGAEHRAIEIAAQLASGRWIVDRGAYWGGERPRAVGRRFVAVPPMASEDYEELRVAFAALDRSTRLVMCQSAAAGVNAVRLTLYPVADIRDIATPQIRAARERALRAPYLHYPSGRPSHLFGNGNGKAVQS